MKVLKNGIFNNANPNLSTKVTCPNCEAELEVDRNDWTHFPNGNCAVGCPCCGFYIEHEPQENKTKQNQQKIIEEIIDCTNFEKIHKAMEALDWRWATVGGKVPTEEELKEQARNLLKTTFERKCDTATGGFWTEYIEADEDGSEGASLSFRIDNTSVWLNKDNEFEYA